VSAGGDFRRPGGLPAQRPEQAPQPMPERVIAPGTPNTFRGRLVIIYGTGAGSGLFVYSGTPGLGNPPILAVTTASTDPYGNVVTPDAITDQAMPFLIYSGAPAAGNLIASFSPDAGTDSFGNPYVAGLVSYSGTGSFTKAAQLLGDTLTFYAPLTGGQNVVLGQSIGTGSIPVGLTLYAGGALTVPPVLTAAAPGSPSGATEQWHTLTLQNSFTVGTDINGTSYPPAIMLMPDGDVRLKGELVTPAAGGVTNTTFATTPGSVYNPVTNIPTATIVNNTGNLAGVVYIRPNGNIQLAGAFGNSASIRLDCRIGLYQV
jgi:hypothetical protein